MGKKSKRRGGTGGGKKSRQTAGTGDVGGSLRLAGDQLAVAAAGPAATPADALALLETVPPPTSLKGIVSTNDDPGKCAKCLSPAALFAPPGTPGVRFSPYCLMCCGKRLCRACRADTNEYAPDLLGEHRCTFCNTLWSSRFSLCLQAATAGKTWAQYSMGLYYMYLAGDSPSQAFAFDYMVKAASQGHPEAFLLLSELCRGQFGHPRDLTAAQAFARKARSFYPDLRLNSNTMLLYIAEDYLEDGAVEEVMGILSDVAKEADPDHVLDGELCDAIASLAYRIDDDQLAGEMFARAFCHGVVQSALPASECYFVMEHYCLSKLWLSVACKTKSGYHFCKAKVDGNVTLVPWSFYKQRRDQIRSKLREISDSCGGCGDALEGDTRKYCRGCKAFCYCSRECQKLHWNRADCGHRAECKEAQDQARKIMEAIQSGKVDLSKKNDDE